MRVLIVEDNPGDRTLLSIMLEDHGYCEILHADTLAAALVKLLGPESQKPEVVLLDLMLPDSRGLDSLRRVREAAPDVAMVVLTSLEDDELALAADREGAQDYFIKGKLGPEVLDRCIRHAVERDRIRRQVFERESLLRVAYEGMSLIPWDLDLATNTMRAGAFMHSRPALGPNGQITAYLARVHPEDRHRLQGDVQGVLDHAGEGKFEYRLLENDGTYRWHQTVFRAQPRDVAPASRVLGVTVDVHRRRLAEDMLSALSQDLARLSGPDFLQSLVLRLNATLGTRWAIVMRLDDDDGSVARTMAIADRSSLQPDTLYSIPDSPCEKVLATGAAYFRGDLQSLFPGRPSLIAMEAQSYCGTALVDSKGRNLGILMVLNDAALPGESEVIQQTLRICAPRVSAEIERMMTQQSLEASEARLRQAQKMEAIGTLASGIAHDFTNLLTAVRGHASLATSMLGPDHPALENLKQLEEAARQASGVASSLLTFARRSRPDMAWTPLLPLLESSVSLFKSMTPPDVPLDLDLEPARGLAIFADATQVRQMLINLLLNAADAVITGGRVSLRAAFETGLDGAAMVRILVADTGIGIPDDAKSHIFEPFFTTKPQGSGLGLAVVHGVATEHGWTIELQSQLGQGTTFSIRAPARADDAEAAPGAAPTWSAKHALVVMRARLPRGLVAGALASLGLEVLQAVDEREARQLLTQENIRVDLAVIDHAMDTPGLPPLWSEIYARSPQARCVIVGPESGTGLISPGVYAIERPFQLTSLNAAIAILSRNPPESAPDIASHAHQGEPAADQGPRP
ncbi:MAG: response regulator [Tepidisphaera sp.]|nr:response regulator [Tepidisphaera sp.]